MTTTTTNSTTTRAAALRAIMLRAWSIRRAAAAAVGCKPSAVDPRAALAMAWAEARRASGTISPAARAIRAEYAELAADGDALLLFARRAVRSAAKQAIRYSERDNYDQRNDGIAFSAYFLQPGAADDIAMELFASCSTRRGARYELAAIVNDDARLSAIVDGRAAAGRDTCLYQIAVSCARSAAARLWRQDRRNAAQDRVRRDDDGKETSTVESFVGTDGKPAAGVPRRVTETAAITRAAIAAALDGIDSTDQIIVAGLMDGRTERRIADVAGISAPAVHKRIVKLRARLAAAGLR